MWNNKGFGPKDPGQERDTTKPSAFDQQHPIRADYPLEDIQDSETVESLFIKMKAQLPFVFRYKLQDEVETRTVHLTGIARQADRLLAIAVKVLDPGWQAAVLSYGMVVHSPHAAATCPPERVSAKVEARAYFGTGLIAGNNAPAPTRSFTRPGTFATAAFA